MPYSAEHKQQTRARIVEAARILFNRHGFHEVTIDMLMNEAGLTRGGFYNHFENKEQVFAEAVLSFLEGRGAKWREGAGIDLTRLQPEMAQHMIDAYLSTEHLGDLDGQCPMIALPSDIARGGLAAQRSFQHLLEAMVWLFEANMNPDGQANEQWARSLAALCIGGMVVARALPETEQASAVRRAAHEAATKILQEQQLAGQAGSHL